NSWDDPLPADLFLWICVRGDPGDRASAPQFSQEVASGTPRRDAETERRGEWAKGRSGISRHRLIASSPFSPLRVPPPRAPSHLLVIPLLSSTSRVSLAPPQSVR